MNNNSIIKSKLPINKTIEQAWKFFSNNFKAIMSYYPQYFLIYCGLFYVFTLISYSFDHASVIGSIFSVLSFLSFIFTFPLATAFIIKNIVTSTKQTLYPKLWSPLNNIKIYVGYTFGFLAIMLCQIGLGYLLGMIFAAPFTGVNQVIIKYGTMLAIGAFCIFKLNSKMLAYPIKIEHPKLKFRQLLSLSTTIVTGNELRFFFIIMFLITPINVAVDKIIDKLISYLGYTGEQLLLITIFSTSVTGFFSIVFFSILLGHIYQFFKPKITILCS